MAVLEIKSGTATKEFTLDVSKEGYHLTVVAYGDMWNEDFKTLVDLYKYLKAEWHFTELLIVNLLKVANIS